MKICEIITAFTEIAFAVMAGLAFYLTVFAVIVAIYCLIFKPKKKLDKK